MLVTGMMAPVAELVTSVVQVAFQMPVPVVVAQATAILTTVLLSN